MSPNRRVTITLMREAPPLPANFTALRPLKKGHLAALRGRKTLVLSYDRR